jgi:2-aminoethylphosphonate-pyruvate transaminase
VDETIAPAAEKLLFTPGPLTTSESVKRAMLRDAGSRDSDFIATVGSIRGRLLGLAGASDVAYTTVLLPGSGTYAVESVITSAVPRDGRLLVAVNGSYGERMVRIAEVAGIRASALRFEEGSPVEPAAVANALDADPSVTHVAVVHCETTTGLLNPVEELGRLVKERGRRFIVDAMSSFGAVSLDVEGVGVDFLVSSANKCIEGVPGFSFAIASREALEEATHARSLSLDLLAQWKGLEKDGQFRFTPPTHALLAFDQALRELEDEGGVEGRGRRYDANHRVLVEGMRRLKFREYLSPERQSYIITSFRYPTHASFGFEEFYRRLSEKGFVIYPGKLSKIDCFRIGTIGRIFEEDIRRLVEAIGSTLADMGCPDGS